MFNTRKFQVFSAMRTRQKALSRTEKLEYQIFKHAKQYKVANHDFFGLFMKFYD